MFGDAGGGQWVAGPSFPSTSNHPTRISRPATECSFQLCTLGVARVEGKAQGVRASSKLK